MRSLFTKKRCQKSLKQLKTLPSAEFLDSGRKLETYMMMGILLLFGVWGVKNFFDLSQFQKQPQKMDVKLAVEQPAKPKNLESFILEGTAHKPRISLAHAVETSPRQTSGSCSLQRTDILDRHGALLATDISKNHLTFHLKEYTFASTKERKSFAQKIAAILPSKSVRHIEKSLQGNGQYVSVARGLSSKQVQELKMLDDRFAGLIGLTDSQSRVYPKPETFGAVMGFVNDRYCGASGLEQALNQELQGGEDSVRLSLDEKAQFILQDELLGQMERTGAVRAMGVLMDVETGHVRSQVSLPSLDFNQFNYLSNHEPELTKRYESDQTKAAYEFGSVFKIFNTAMTIERGVGVYQEYKTLQPLRVGGHTIVEPHPEKRNLNVAGIFVRSNNIGSSLMGIETGHKEQIRTFLELGLSTREKLDNEKTRGLASVATRSFGYGISTDLVSLSAAVATVINGGVRVNPVYLDKVRSRNKPRVFSAETSHMMRRLMLTNVTNRAGTGTSAYQEGVLLGGKTGTANVYLGVGHPEADKRGYSNKTLATFIGAFPIDKPKYVLAVTLFEPQDDKGKPMNAGGASAPVAGRIAQRVAFSEGLLRDPDQARIFEEQFSIPYQHEQVRVAQN